ncbi:MAG: uroporphyrinogen decarboxylase family protein [Candidatus Latescibacterota bacterium]
MIQGMSSSERIRATVRRQPVDHLPLCFDGICHGIIGFLEARRTTPLEKAGFLLDLGLDTAITVSPSLVSQRQIEIREWQENPVGEACPMLHREYHTPQGVLRQVVRRTEDHPGRIHLFSDHNVPPGRSLTYLVEDERDLDALAWVLRPPAGDELDRFRREVEEYRPFCREHGILLSGYLEGVGDPLIWLSGVERAVLAAVDQPAFMARYAEIVSAWDRARLQLMLDAGVELIVRRGWYESTDFWSPSLYRQLLQEPLRREIELAHQAGALFTYVMNSGAMPLLGSFRELGFDVLSNLDPLVTGTDLEILKQRLGDRVTLCGGVNNNLVLELGTPAEVRAAVAEAVARLAPGGGFILAPGDSILSTTETAIRNFHLLVEAWKELAA